MLISWHRDGDESINRRIWSGEEPLEKPLTGTFLAVHPCRIQCDIFVEPEIRVTLIDMHTEILVVIYLMLHTRMITHALGNCKKLTQAKLFRLDGSKNINIYICIMQQAKVLPVLISFWKLQYRILEFIFSSKTQQIYSDKTFLYT